MAKPRHEKLNLDLIAPALQQAALEDIKHGDVVGFLSEAERGNTDWLAIVAQNATGPLQRGLYEEALLSSWANTRTNHARVGPSDLRLLFALADAARLRTLGDPLPGPGRFTVYRGIAGAGALRRRRGISWTSDFDQACWFAARYALPKPEVIRLEIKASDMLVYLHDGQYGRGESEFLILLSRRHRIAVQTRDARSIKIAAGRQGEKNHAAMMAQLERLRPSEPDR